jgi:hypothetical protein
VNSEPTVPFEAQRPIPSPGSVRSPVPLGGDYAPEQVAATLTETRKLVTDGIVEIPQGQPIPIEQFAEAVAVAETPARGTKPLLVFS